MGDAMGDARGDVPGRIEKCGLGDSYKLPRTEYKVSDRAEVQKSTSDIGRPADPRSLPSNHQCLAQLGPFVKFGSALMLDCTPVSHVKFAPSWAMSLTRPKYEARLPWRSCNKCPFPTLYYPCPQVSPKLPSSIWLDPPPASRMGLPLRQLSVKSIKRLRSRRVRHDGRLHAMHFPAAPLLANGRRRALALVFALSVLLVGPHGVHSKAQADQIYDANDALDLSVAMRGFGAETYSMSSVMPRELCAIWQDLYLP